MLGERVGGFAYHARVGTCACAGSRRLPRTPGSSQEAKTLQNKSIFSQAVSLRIKKHKSLNYLKTRKGKSAEAKITFSRSLSYLLGPLREKLCALDPA